VGSGCRSDCEEQQGGQGYEAMEEHDGILYSGSRKSYSSVARRQRALYGVDYHSLLFFCLSSRAYDLVSEEALPSPWFKTWRYFGLRIMDLLEVLRGYCRVGIAPGQPTDPGRGGLFIAANQACLALYCFSSRGSGIDT
jgi:hypothetical protein